MSKYLFASTILLLMFTRSALAQQRAAPDTIPATIDVEQDENKTVIKAGLRPLRQIAGAPEAFYTYFWEFGDGTFSFAPQPVHHYKDTGNYEIRLYATNNYDDGKAPKGKPRRIKVKKTMYAAADAPSSFFAASDMLAMKTNRMPKPGEEMVTIVGYRHPGGTSAVSGSLLLFYNEKQFAQKNFVLSEERKYNNERKFGLDSLMAMAPSEDLYVPLAGGPSNAAWIDPVRKTALAGMLSEKKADRKSADGSREVWHEKGEVIVTESGREIARLTGYDKAPLLKLDRRGKRVAIVRRVGPKSPNAIEIHELPSGKLLGRLEHDNPVTCLDWADELLVAGGSSNRLIHLWDTQRFRLLHRFSGHQADLETVIFRKGGQEFISMARDGMLRVWHAGCAAEVMTLSGLPEHAGQGEWSADGTRLKLRRFDNSGTSVFRFNWPRNVRVLGPGIVEPRSENIPSLDLDHEGKFAATTDESGCRLWATDTGSMAGLFPKLDREWLSCALAPDASALWLVGWNSPMRKIPVKTGAWPEIGQPEKIGPGPGPLLVAMNADGSAVAMTQNLPEVRDDFVGVLGTRDGKFTRLAQVDPFSAAFSPDGKRVVTGSFRSKGAQIWSLPEGRQEKTLEHPELVTNAAFTAGGEELWLWSGKALSRWRSGDWSQEGELVRSVPPGLTVDRKGSLAASVTRQAVVIHRAGDLQELARLAVPEQAGEVGMATLQFSGDGRRLGLHTADGNLVLWDLPGLRAELARMGMDWVD